MKPVAKKVVPILPCVLLVFVPAVLAAERVRRQSVPRTFQVVPGEPIRLLLTVHADTAAPILVHLPTDPLLVLRAREKFPLRRTTAGVFVHKRAITWQALEPGVVKLRSIAVQTQSRRLLFPEITIEVRDPGP